MEADPVKKLQLTDFDLKQTIGTGIIRPHRLFIKWL